MRTQTGAMSGWLKIALVFVVLVVAGLIALFVFVKNTFKTDPKEIASVLETVVKLKAPLPQSFHSQLAVTTPSVTLVMLAHEPDKGELGIGSAKIDGQTDPQKIVDHVASSMGKGGSSKFVEQKRGEEECAGKKFEYVIGTVEKDGGTSRTSMIGFFPPDGQGRTVFLYGLNGGEGDYDMKVTDEFLQNIESLP